MRTQNISFQQNTNIKFINNQEWNNLPLSGLLDSDRYIFAGDMQDTKYLDEGYTDEVGICPGGGVTNKQQVYFLHLKPALNRDKAALKQGLSEAIEPLRAENNNLSGLLIGAKSANPESLDFFDTVQDTLQEEGVDLSTFKGQQPRGVSNIHYSSKEDTWRINTVTDVFKPDDTVVINEERLNTAFDEKVVSDNALLSF